MVEPGGLALQAGQEGGGGQHQVHQRVVTQRVGRGQLQPGQAGQPPDVPVEAGDGGAVVGQPGPAPLPRPAPLPVIISQRQVWGFSRQGNQQTGNSFSKFCAFLI